MEPLNTANASSSSRSRTGASTSRLARYPVPDASHVEADNLNRTVVRGDRRFHPPTEIPDDSHERTYKVDDIHLLKEREAKSLGTLETVQDWFGPIYQDSVVSKIQRALKRLTVR